MVLLIGPQSFSGRGAQVMIRLAMRASTVTGGLVVVLEVLVEGAEGISGATCAPVDDVGTDTNDGIDVAVVVEEE